MAEGPADDPLLVDFQYWLLGIVLLFVIVFVGSASATALQFAGVPYGGAIGGIGGALIAFLAVSYWYTVGRTRSRIATEDGPRSLPR